MEINRLHHIECAGKNILYVIREIDRYYFRLEMMFPFAGVIIDFFDENTNFEKETDRQFYDHIILDMYQTLRVVHGQFRHKSIEERKKMLKEGLIRKEIVLIASTQSPNYCPKYWGKGFTDAVESKVTGFLKSSNYSDLRIPELEYPEILNNLLYEFGECHNAEFETVQKVNFHWLRNFHNDSRYQNFLFKKLQSGYPKNSMPKMFTKEVGFEDFTEAEKGILPFFVGTQFGIYPKITNELYEKLEGQKIAILGKSLLSGHESGLSICKVKEGKIITLDRFENVPKEKTQNVEGTLTEEPSSIVFSPKKLLYKCKVDDETCLVSKENNAAETGFIMTMHYPFRQVQWDFDDPDIESEADMQNAIPEVAKMMKTLYTAVEVNKDYYLKTSFYNKQANPAVDENLLRSFFVERIYGSFGANPTYFPETQPFHWAKAWLRSVIQKILESRSFSEFIRPGEYWEAEQKYEKDGYTIIDITLYKDTELEKVFNLMTEQQKKKLMLSKEHGYGSQFDELLERWAIENRLSNEK